MSTQQTTGSARVPTARSEGFLDGGLFVAGLTIGVAPAVAAAGMMLGSRLVALGATAALLLTGFVIAAISSVWSEL